MSPGTDDAIIAVAMAPSLLTVAQIVSFLEDLAPPALAETWDNVGLLVGDHGATTAKVMTCLTLTEDVASEAAAADVGLIVTHHPVLFRPVKRITAETSEGRSLLILLRAGIAVYSPHTAFDSAAEGINHRLAGTLRLSNIHPLRPAGDAVSAAAGGGRFGVLEKATSLADFVTRIRAALGVPAISFVGQPDRSIRTVAVACGSAAEFIDDADSSQCDVLVTGEARFHACLDARTRGIALILAGHYATERPAVEELATVIGERFPALECWASRTERDPLQWSL